ncbi:hypothetical protein GQ600_17047 [Phytophthora cactorum]|nr:hypothetical protein GQ600_17047 [Phytophthora cactorum]
MTGRILTPLKEGALGWLLPSVRAAVNTLSGSITFIRQSAEWGMGSAKKVFHRLVLHLPYDKEKRRQCLDNIFVTPTTELEQ